MNQNECTGKTMSFAVSGIYTAILYKADAVDEDKEYKIVQDLPFFACTEKASSNHRFCAGSVVPVSEMPQPDCHLLKRRIQLHGEAAQWRQATVQWQTHEQRYRSLSIFFPLPS